jgi:dihydrofolate reductase
VRKVIVCNAMTLDGYYAGPDESAMVLELGPVFDAYNAERLRAADILLLGRRSYEGFKGFWAPIANDPDPKYTDEQRDVSRLDNEIDKVVVSDTLTQADTDPWPNTRIIKRDKAHDEIAELKRAQGKEILVFGSRTLWSDLLAHGLVDELHVMVGPVVVGDGTPMFKEPLTSAHRPDRPFESRHSLRLLDTRTWDDAGNVLMRFAVEANEA